MDEARMKEQRCGMQKRLMTFQCISKLSKSRDEILSNDEIIIHGKMSLFSISINLNTLTVSALHDEVTNVNR